MALVGMFLGVAFYVHQDLKADMRGIQGDISRNLSAHATNANVHVVSGLTAAAPSPESDESDGRIGRLDLQSLPLPPAGNSRDSASTFAHVKWVALAIAAGALLWLIWRIATLTGRTREQGARE